MRKLKLMIYGIHMTRITECEYIKMCLKLCGTVTKTAPSAFEFEVASPILIYVFSNASLKLPMYISMCNSVLCV